MYICQHISLNILVYFQYFYYVGVFLHFLIFFDIFSVFFEKEKGKGRAAAGGTCNEPCLHPPKKEPVWLASYQTGSFLVLISLVTQQTGYYTNSRRNRPLPGGFHGCPVR